jgi:hypothetical protein
VWQLTGWLHLNILPSTVAHTRDKKRNELYFTIVFYKDDYKGIVVVYHSVRRCYASLGLSLRRTYVKPTVPLHAVVSTTEYSIMDLDSKLPNLIHHHPFIISYRTFAYV